MQKVKAHVRHGNLVQSYVRRGREAAKRLFERHYQAIDRWTWQSVRHQQRMGIHVDADDDAYQVGMEAAFLALHRYSQSRGSLENYLRGAIKYAVLKYIHAERARGLTGVRSLYDRLRAAGSQEGREVVLRAFPRIEEIRETEPAPSIEDSIEGSRALLKRDEYVADLEREFGSRLDRVRQYLAGKEKAKRTWKRTHLVERRLTVFRLRALQQMSWRQIAKQLGIDPKMARTDYQQIFSIIREAQEKIHMVKKAVTGKQRLREWRLHRLLFDLDRLRIAIWMGFPPEHIEFIRDVIVGILIDLDESES